MKTDYRMEKTFGSCYSSDRELISRLELKKIQEIEKN